MKDKVRGRRGEERKGIKEGVEGEGRKEKGWMREKGAKEEGRGSRNGNRRKGRKRGKERGVKKRGERSREKE